MRRAYPPPSTIRTVEASLTEEHTFDLRELLPEECGLAAAIRLPNASRYVYDCLMLQEHRGEHGVGILSLDEQDFHTRLRLGSVREQFVDFDLDAGLPGQNAIGHNRYATRGEPKARTNIQPIFFNYTRYGPFAIAHNGTLIDRDDLRAQLVEEGVVFQTTMDSEVFGHLIAQSKAPTLEEAVIAAAQQIETAYALLVFSRDRVIALRDRYGVRPLSLGKLDEGYLVCSENYALDQYPNVIPLPDLEPGEMAIFDLNNGDLQRSFYAEPDEHFCVFEGMYFSDPRSRYRGYWHEDFRYALGQKLVEENPDMKGDCVIPVLDSGKHAALGIAEASGIPYHEYFKRLHNPPRASRRSFTAATYEERVRTAYQKLHLRKKQIEGKHVIVVDDSIVRSTTIQIINQRLREAGALSIINCISAPAIINVCYFGMDFQDQNQLIAYHKSVDEIAAKVGADRLIYLSLEALEEVVTDTYGCGVCSGCFGGRYPGL